MTKARQQIKVFKMSPIEAKNQKAVVKKARALQERILARRGGEPLPPSWQDINRTREEG